MIEAIINNVDDPKLLSQLAKGRMKKKCKGCSFVIMGGDGSR